jgi:mono/diheme cytochrome c family protein
MTRALFLLLVAAASHAQQGAIERGAQLYRTHCATPYCHGPDGIPGRAPRLIGHHFNVNQMFKVITWGIPGTGMPEFTTRLKTGEIADLVAYAMTLGGSATAPAPAPVTPPRALTPEARQGRALFFDAARTGACGSCHELDGWGVPVGPNLTALPPGRFTDLRGAESGREVTREVSGVVTARPKGGEPPFPALLVERTEARVQVYDLTAPLPVLRTFAAGQIVLQAGSSWRHEQAARIYTTRELETIAVYLRSRAGQ